MPERLLWKLLVVALLVPAFDDARASDVRARISLRNGRTRFLAGEPIVLDLVVGSLDGPTSIDRTTDESQMSIDQVEVDPPIGVYPWRADSERFSPRWGDTFFRYPESTEFRTTLTLNRRFRFDAAGTYSVRVVTSRVKPAATSERVTFTVSEPTVDEQGARARELDRAIREATDPKKAATIATRIDWLSDDAATEVKLALLVAPENRTATFGTTSACGSHATGNAWCAVSRRPSSTRPKTCRWEAHCSAC